MFSLIKNNVMLILTVNLGLLIFYYKIVYSFIVYSFSMQYGDTMSFARSVCCLHLLSDFAIPDQLFICNYLYCDYIICCIL